ncbi:MAG: ATP-binding protein [Gammaproteobacteria bacterium]|nr:ATP-binding protein [Gammaproteobacteria bacterium]|tara:strand:+ start:14517 stop:16340 length:1824 start_codon:yes stop_codon:yes gene_type:complete
MNTNDDVVQRDLYDGEVIPPALAVKAMRDSGYKNTAYALAELIDNSIQADATLVEVFCVERRTLVSQRERKRIAEIGVLDNGSGMEGSTLRLALQFGNGTHLQDRSGIGRFGMGLPNASISQCRRVDIWTWRAGPANAIHTCLDIDDIESGNVRAVPPPRPQKVPDEWLNRAEDAGTSGTLVVWSNFEDHRLTWKSARPTLEHTEFLSGRMYRKFINEGQVEIRLVALDDESVVIDRRAKVNDPLYLMAPSSTPSPFNDQPMFQAWGEHMKFSIGHEGQTHDVWVRMSFARRETLPEDGTARGNKEYGKHAAKNIGVSIVRAGRELDLDDSWAIGYEPTERWWGAEVEFPPALDEVFGVTNNKQAATVLSHMAKFDWEAEAEPGESFMDFKRRLEGEGDPRYHLIDIVYYIEEQLGRIRKSLRDQTKGRGPGVKRHDDVSVEDTASTKWKERSAQGYKTEGDQQTYDEEAERKLYEDLTKNKHYDEDVAREICRAVATRQRRIIFVAAEADSQAFFNVDPRPGGIIEIVFNSRHPAYEKLIRALETDVTEASDSDLVSRIQNASDTLKLLLAAWARYEEEDLPSREKIRDIRHEWGKMAKGFIGQGS